MKGGREKGKNLTNAMKHIYTALGELLEIA